MEAFGEALLRGMGGNWEPGKGLGKNGTGMAVPIGMSELLYIYSMCGAHMFATHINTRSNTRKHIAHPEVCQSCFLRGSTRLAISHSHA